MFKFKKFNNFLKKIYRSIIPKKSYEWYIVINTIGVNTVQLKKILCHNGKPAYMAFFTCIGPFLSEEDGKGHYEKFLKIAEEENKKRLKPT